MLIPASLKTDQRFPAFHSRSNCSHGLIAFVLTIRSVSFINSKFPCLLEAWFIELPANDIHPITHKLKQVLTNIHPIISEFLFRSREFYARKSSIIPLAQIL